MQVYELPWKDAVQVYELHEKMQYKGVTQPEQKKEQMFVPQKSFKLMTLDF